MRKYDIGFWPSQSSSSVYRSRKIDPGEITGPFRLMLRLNKYHHKGDKQPTYVGHIEPEEMEDQSANATAAVQSRYNIGFWRIKSDEAVYRSRVIDQKEIAGPFRLILRKNKFYHKGSTQPTYICYIAADEVSEPIQEDNASDDLQALKELIIEANQATAIITTPEESHALANNYWRRIIQEIQILTGERINIQVWGPSSDDNK